MLIPAAITIILLLAAGGMVGDDGVITNPNYDGVRTSMWVFAGITFVWLVSWVVRVVISWIRGSKEIDKSS